MRLPYRKKPNKARWMHQRWYWRNVDVDKIEFVELARPTHRRVRRKGEKRIRRGWRVVRRVEVANGAVYRLRGMGPDGHFIT